MHRIWSALRHAPGLHGRRRCSSGLRTVEAASRIHGGRQSGRAEERARQVFTREAIAIIVVLPLDFEAEALAAVGLVGL